MPNASTFAWQPAFLQYACVQFRRSARASCVYARARRVYREKTQAAHIDADAPFFFFSGHVFFHGVRPSRHAVQTEEEEASSFVPRRRWSRRSEPGIYQIARWGFS